MSTTEGTEAPSAPPAAPDRQITLLVVGDNGVGKRPLVSRFLNKNVLNGQRDLNIDGLNVRARVVVVDDNKRPGVVKYCPYYKDAAGALLFYDVTNFQSFKNIDWWLEAVRGWGKNRRNFVMVLVANKHSARLSFVGAAEQGQKLSQKEKLTLVETSDIGDENINQTFETILAEIIKLPDAGGAPSCICIDPPMCNHVIDILLISREEKRVALHFGLVM